MFSYLGPICPICGGEDCYREITPYFRYAIELFPDVKAERIAIARFLCRSERVTFSLLPIQLIPYFQYTVNAVIGALLLGLGWWQMGQRGFYGASIDVDPDSDVTPWLIVCWLKMIVRGFRRAHAVLRRFYDLSGIRTNQGTVPWKEVEGYFLAFGLKLDVPWPPLLFGLSDRYSRQTRLFLFGIPSQHRLSRCP